MTHPPGPAMTSPREIGQRARVLLAELNTIGNDLRSSPQHAHEKKLAAIEAALRSTGAEGWEPIESAPKDGTGLLLFEPGNKVKRRYAIVGRGEFFTGFFSVYWQSWHSSPGDYRRHPTHWRPLPAPPVSDTGGRG